MGNTKSTFQQKAYDYIKSQILNLGYKPGMVITDTQIAAELKISRTPVREAFHRLENEGMLTSEAHRGWRVYTLSLDDIHEIFDIKVVLEGMLARNAAECEDEKLRTTLENSLEKMIEATENKDPEDWYDADVLLHDTLFEMNSNDRAYRIISNLNDQWHRVRIGFAALEGRMERSTKEHIAFVQAILARDGDEAEHQMRIHMNNVREELVRLLEKLVLPFVEEGV
jgi:DNA-binding GntR family transcriptional regulator